MTSGDENAHVLVVDDESDLLQVLTGYLHRIGFQVTAASDPDAALHAANTEPIDVVLTDLCLGGACGITFIERLWTLHPEMPVVLMSGATPDLGVVPGLTFVPKPFAMADIAAHLRRALLQREQQSV